MEVFSGARNFEVLSVEEKEFALNTTVQYAPRAYEYIRNCKASADGLTIEKLGRETPLSELPAWTWDKAQSFPVSFHSIYGLQTRSLTIPDGLEEPCKWQATLANSRVLRVLSYHQRRKDWTQDRHFRH